MEHTGLIAPNSTFTLQVSDGHQKIRLDRYIADQFPFYSRSYFQHMIDNNQITINGKQVDKASTPVLAGDTIVVQFAGERSLTPSELTSDALAVEIIHEHEHFLTVNKPAGLLVHAPNLTSTEPTLVDWITHHYKDIAHVGCVDRPGIVHRLDKNTSGLMIIPRTNYAHSYFGELFRERNIHKTYYALVEGHPSPNGSIELAIGRDPVHRSKMKAFKVLDQFAAKSHGIKMRHATSHYKVLEYFDELSLVEIKPITGRTHQIRVHLAAIGHPIVGDHIYGSTSSLIDRHALHAGKISFEFDDKPYTCTAQLPDDMQQAIMQLRTSKK